MELQKLLQDEIREGLYRITISGPKGNSDVSKVRIRPVEIKGKLLFQCQETVGTKEFHKNLTKDDVITEIRNWMNGTFKQMQLESDTCTASVLVSKKGTMTIKKKRPHMSLGRLTLLIDLIIILIGWPVFGDVDSVLYGLIAVFVCSMVIDKILYGIGAGSLAIIVTSKGEETAEEIGRITDRGVTSLEGMGTYTKSKRNVLLCACSKSEAYLVKNAVYQVDDSAFVMFTETSEVLGEGFKESLDEL